MSYRMCRNLLQKKGIAGKITALVALNLNLSSGAVALAGTVPVAPAAPVHHTTAPTAAPRPTTSTTQSINLSSAGKTVGASSAGTIKVGNSTLNIQAGQHITAAEAVALSQVVQTGHQSLLLGSLGTAVGGMLNISGANTISSLVIPKGVTALDNISNSAALNLTGNLRNAGSLYVFSNNSSSTTALISAQNIFNLTGATISSMLPNNNNFGITGALSSINLNLTAVNRIFNAGIISSSGNLGLSAGGSITNALPHGVSGLTPTIQAMGNVNLTSNNIVNAGLINSIAGNINIGAINTAAINVNNQTGTMQALLGNINVRDSLFTTKSDFNLLGGNLFSQQLNINSGNGIANINVDQISGVLNVNAGEAHTLVSAGNLALGVQNLSGDPTYFNTAGDVTLSSDLTFNGQDLAIVAKGSILTANPPTTIHIDTSSTTNGGNITLIAGAKFTSNPSSSGQVNGDSLSTLTITGGSTTGGVINLVGTNPIASFTSSSSTGNAGNITLVAYKGTTSGSGFISLPTSGTLNASGATANGNVTLIAGATTGGAISMGGINNAGAGTGGNISINTATPTITAPSGAKTIVITDGTVTHGTFAPGVLTAGSATLNSAVNAGGTFTLNSKGTVQVSDITADGDISISALRFTNGIFGSNNGNITSNGGNISITAASNLFTTSGGQTFLVQNAITTNGVLTAQGNITLQTTSNGNIDINKNINASGLVKVSANGIGNVVTPNQLIADPGVGGYAFGAAVTPDGKWAYVPNNTDNTISVIDTSTNTVVSTINLNLLSIGTATSPKGAVSSPDGQFIYVVADPTTGTPGVKLAGTGEVLVIDTATKAVVGSPITFTAANTTAQAAFDPQLIAVAPKTGKIYILSDYSNNMGTGTSPNSEITVIDPNNLATPQQSITLSGFSTNTSLAGAIAINPQNTFAYVGSSNGSVIDVINLTTFTKGTPISTASLNAAFAQFRSSSIPQALGLSFDPSGSKLYVGISDGNFSASLGQIAVIDTTAGSPKYNQFILTSQIFGGGGNNQGTGGFLPQGISATPTGTQLFTNPTYIGQNENAVQPDPPLPPILASNELELIFNPITAGLVEVPNIGDNKAPDGYGSNTFSQIVLNSGVNNIQTYIAAPSHNGSNGSVLVMQTPTIRGGNGVTLSSGGGNILVDYDSGGHAFSANTAGNGSIIAGNVGTAASTIAASSAGSGSGTIFQLGSIGSLTITGPISASLVSIETTSTALNSSNIQIGASIGRAGASSVSIFATNNGNITQTSPSARLIGATVTLGTDTGNIGFYNDGALLTDQRVQTQCNNLTVSSTNGNIFVNNAKAGVLGLNASATGNNFMVSASGSIVIGSNSSILVNNVELITNKGSNGSLSIGTSLGSGSGAGTSVTLFADGVGNILTVGSTQANPIVFKGDVIGFNPVLSPLNAVDPTIPVKFSGSVGSAANVFLIQANTVSANTSSGNVFLDNTGTSGTTNVLSSSAGNTFSLTTGGGINVNGPVIAPNVTLKCTGTDNSIVINGNIGKGGGTVALTATGTGTITSVSANSVVPPGTQLLLAGAATNLVGTGSGALLFIPNGNVIDVFDKNNGNAAVGTPISLARNSGDTNTPLGIVSSADGNTLYVAEIGTDQGIAIINRTNNNAITFLPLTSGSADLAPQSLTLSADGTTLYVVSSSSNAAGNEVLNLSIVDVQTATPFVTKTLSLGVTNSEVSSIAVSGNVAYVSNSATRSVSVISNLSTTPKVTSTISLTSFLGQRPVLLRIAGATPTLYAVMSPDSDTFGNATVPFTTLGPVAEISLATNKIIGSSATVTGTTVTLTSSHGIGNTGTLLIDPSDSTALNNTVTSPTPINTIASKITASASVGDVFLNNGLPVTLSAAAGLPNTISVLNNGTITTPLNWSVTGTNISLTAISGSNGAISLGGQVGATGSTVTLSADGTGGISQGAGAFTITGTTVTLNANGNIGSSLIPIRTITATLSAGSQSTTNTFVTNTGNLNLGNSGANSVFQLKNTGNINVTGNVIGSTVSIQALDGTAVSAGPGNIDIGLNTNIGFDPDPFLGAIGSNVTLNAAGAITNSGGSGQSMVRGQNVTLITGTGDIGAGGSSLSNLVSTAATNLTISAKGSAFIDWEETNDLQGFGIPGNLKASTVSGVVGDSTDTFGIFSFRPINVIGTVLAQNIDFQIYAGLPGNITIGANLGSSTAPTSNVTLLADGFNSIFQTAGTIFTTTLTIAGTTSGNIGTAAQPIRSTAGTFNFGSSNGNVFLSNNNANLTVTEVSPAAGTGGTIKIVNTGNINVTPSVTPETPATITGDTTANSDVVTLTNPADSSQLTVGAVLSGTGIPARTRITEIGINFTGDFSSTDPTTVSNVANVANLTVGQVVSNPNLPVGTTIVSIGTNSIVLSNAPITPNFTATGVSLNENNGTVTLSNNVTTTATGSSLTNTVPISGNQITIQSTAPNGNISLGGPIVAANRNVMTVGGSSNSKSTINGDKVSITINNSLLGPADTETYLVQAGDTADTIAAALVVKINNNAALQALGISASISGSPTGTGVITLTSTSSALTTYSGAVASTLAHTVATESISKVPVFTPGVINVIAGGTGSITNAAPPSPTVFLNAPAINLSSTSGSIGAGNNPISVGGLTSNVNITSIPTTNTVSAKTTLTGNVFLSTTSSESLLSSTAGSKPGAQFNLTSTAPLTVATGAIVTGANITLAGSGGDITINGTLGALTNVVSVSTNDASSILAGATGKVIGKTIFLDSANGNVGNVQRINTTTAAAQGSNWNLKVTAGGSALVGDSVAVLLDPGTNAGSVLDLQAPSFLTPTGAIVAPTVILKATAGSIGTNANTPFLVTSSQVTASATVGVFIQDTASFQTGVISAPTINLSAQTNFNITLNGNVGSTTSAVTLATTGSGTIHQTSGGLTSNALSVSTIAGDIALTSLTNTISNLSAATGNGISILSSKAMTVKTGVVNGGAGNVSLKTVTGNLTISGNVSSAGNISLEADGTGSIVQGLSTVSVTTTGSLTLTTNSGSAGTSIAPIRTSTAQLALTVGSLSPFGSAFVSNSNSSGGLTLSSSTVGGALSLTDSSPTGVIVGNGAIVTVGTVGRQNLSTSNLTITEKTGNILFDSNSNTTVNGGKIVVQNLNTGGTITFASGATNLSTMVTSGTASSNGTIAIVVGPTIPTTGTIFVPGGASGITVNPSQGGNVLIGKNSDLALISNPNIGAGSATLTAKGRNIILSSVSSNQIIVNAGNTITADPPSPSLVIPAGRAVANLSAPGSVSRMLSQNNVENGFVPAGDTASQKPMAAAVSSASGFAELSTQLQTSTLVLTPTTNLDLTPFNEGTLSSNNQASASEDESSVGNAGTVKLGMLTGGITRSARANSPASTKFLSNGSSLLTPDHDITVETPYGKLQIAAKAIVLVVVSKNGLSIYNVHDEHRDDVSIAVQGAGFKSIPIGQHLMIAKAGADFADVNPLGFITHREVGSDRLQNGLQAIHTQFSILSAISNVEALRSMVHSANPEERRLINRLVKDAAVIMQTNAAAGAYRRISNASDKQQTLASAAR